MGKKIMALLLVGVLSVFVLIGCGGGGDMEEMPEEEGQQQEQQMPEE